MSIELIKSPNWPFPVTGPPPPYSVNSIAAFSQVFYKVQRDDMSGAGYTVVDSGGFVGFILGVVIGASQAGQFIHIAKDETLTNPLGTIPEYLGSHLITQVLGIGQYKTSTPYTINNIDGFLTLQDLDVVTIKAEVTTSAVELETYDQQYKIPYNHPVFAFDLKAGMNPSFNLSKDLYYTATVIITATDRLGALTGTAIDTYNHQLFAAQNTRGYQYGANLNGFVLRSDNPGKFLTSFALPEWYWEREMLLTFYIDEVFVTRVLIRQFYDVNMIPLAVPLTSVINYDKLGISSFSFTFLKGASPANSYYVGFKITEQDEITDLTEEKVYRLDDFCTGRVMMAWINHKGGVDFRAMNIRNLAEIESKQGLKYESAETVDLALNINKERVLKGTAKQRYLISESELAKADLAALTSILRSPLVEIVTYDVVNEQYAKLEVSVVSGFNTPFQAGDKNGHEFQCQIELPDNSELLDNLVTYKL